MLTERQHAPLITETIRTLTLVGTVITNALNTNATSSDTDGQHIVIVGGGMVGISLALLISKWVSQSLSNNKNSRHHRITLIEKFSLKSMPKAELQQSSFDARSTALSAGSMKIFDELGCWQKIQKLAEPIKTIHVSDKGHVANVKINARDFDRDAVGYLVENRHLGSVLLNELKQTAVKCLAPVEVVSCEAKKNGYKLALKYSDEGNGSVPESLHADLLIVADGAESELRQKLGIDAHLTDYKQSALIANVALAQPHNNIAYERFTDTGPIALLPLSPSEFESQSSIGANRAALVWIIPRDQQEQYLSDSNERIISRLQDRFGFRAGEFLSIGLRQAYPLTLIQAAEQVRSNLVVIGNAAHFLHPVAGQGFNLALRDCHQLVNCLAQAGTENKLLGELSVLKQYLDAQRFDQNSTIAVTDALVKIFSSAQLSKALVRQLGLLSLTASTSVKQRFATKMMGMG
jgi:2-polyprenyl-6-methoxyphenol 4-hydroxylase